MFLLALPDCDFVKFQDFSVISHVCGLKASLEFNINLLPLIIKLVYSNGPSQMYLSCPVNGSSNRTLYKTGLKYLKCMLAKKGVVANIAEGQ